MKSRDVQKIVDEVLEGNQDRIKELPELMEDESFRMQYLSLMIDESLLTTAIELETKNNKFKNKGKNPILFKTISALAAVLICAFTLTYINNQKAPVSVLEGNSSYSVGTLLKVDDKLNVNRREKLVLEFSDKSKITLHGPFSAELKENGIILNEGYLDADIRKRNKDKFFVETVHCNIEVLGTKFSVSAQRSSTQLKVSEGEVKIEKGNKSLKVLSGEFALSASTVPFEVYKQESSHLPDKVWRERYKHNILQSLQSKKLLCLYTFDENQILKNAAGNFLHGVLPPDLAKATGRHGKSARSFKDGTGAVIECGDLENSQLKDFSATVWCKADLTLENDVIFTQRDFDPDNLGGWSIHIIDGFLTVWLVTGIEQNGAIEWAKEEIAPFPQKEWKLISLSIQNDVVSVYLDDKKVKELNIAWRPSKHISNLAIGGIDKMSYAYQDVERSRNVFNGVLDEVRLYSKPLSEEEIKLLYDQGKP